MSDNSGNKNSILDLDYESARKFFLRNDSYCNFNLPFYFNFEPLLQKLAKLEKIPSDTKKDSFVKRLSDLDADQVNYILYANKDGRFAWRPLQLINPVAYVYLVKIITSKESWKQIKRQFKKFQKNERIICKSIPLAFNEEPSKSKTIENWYENFEKYAIEKSLEYSYMLETDISNCYGSIYTHSIAWALHPKGKKAAKASPVEKNLPNLVDTILRNISNSQTNGVPQGSELMNLVAELVLGYADLRLSSKIKLKKSGIQEDSYLIVRYRDDYRIFTKNKHDAEKIAKYLSEVLSELNLKLNEDKTFITENIITDAQKSDKLYWRDAFKNKDLNIRILQIHSLSEKYPNSGSIRKALTRFCDDFDVKSVVFDDLILIASVMTDIAFKNPHSYPYLVYILGRINSTIDSDQSKELFDRVQKKLSTMPNSEYLNIWLQRLSKTASIRNFESSRLFKYVQKCVRGESKLPVLWDVSVFDSEVIKIIKNTAIIDIN